MPHRCLAALPLALLLFAPKAAPAVGDSDYVSLRRLIGQEKYPDAVLRCIGLIKAHPDYLRLYETLPEVAQYAGEIDQAITFLESRVDDGTDLPYVYFALGTAYYDKHDFRTSVIYYNHAIECGNNTPECYKGLEYAYEKLEGLEAATRYFNLLCHRDPQNSNNWYGLALAYWTRPDYDRVRSCLAEALSRKPDEQRYQQARVATAYLRGETDSVAGSMSGLIARAQQELDFGAVQFLRSFVVIGHFSRDSYQSAVGTIEEIITDSKTYGLLRWLGWGYKRMADVKFLMGEYQASISYAKEASTVAERVGDEELMLAILSRQFEVYSEIGDYYDALETAYQEMVFSQDVGHPFDRIRPLVDISCALHDMGSDDLALDFAVDALGKCETVKSDFRLLYQIHICLGLIYEGLESFGESARHFRLAADLIPRDNFWARNMAVCQGHLGRALLRMGRFIESYKHLRIQLKLAQLQGFEREVCYAKANLGMLYLEQRNDNLASVYFRDGYEHGRHLGQLPSILVCCRGLSILAERSNRLNESALWREQAIRTNESMGLWHERLTLLGCTDHELARDYREYVRLLCRLGQPDRAFEVAERAKLLTMVKLVNIPQVAKGLSGADPLRERLMSAEKEISRLHSILATKRTTEVPPDSTDTLLKTISNLNHFEMVFQRTLDTLRTHNVKFQQLTSPSTYSLDEIRDCFLDSSRAIVEYVVGDQEITALVLRRSVTRSCSMRVSGNDLKKLLSSISTVFSDAESKLPVMNAAIANFDLNALHDAYKMVFQPLLPLLKGVSQITVVSDGILYNLPFDILVTEFHRCTESHRRGDPQFLVESFDIANQLSVTTAMRALRIERTPSRMLLAVGDALPERRDLNGETPMPGLSGSTQSLPSRVFPGVRRELAAIRRMFGDDADLLIQGEATPTRLLNSARAYRILHIAAHVSFDETRPMYSRIALSPEPRGLGPTGMLSISFLSIDLNAHLVVLSGCNTGRISPSAGLPGMTSAIILSGVPNVISSLWNVDDEVTAQLMESFYANLRSGIGVRDALKKAKLDMIRSGKSDPFYWGAFILTGNNEKVLGFSDESAPKNRITLGFLVAGLSLLFLLSMVFVVLRAIRRRDLTRMQL